MFLTTSPGLADVMWFSPGSLFDWSSKGRSHTDDAHGDRFPGLAPLTKAGLLEIKEIKIIVQLWKRRTDWQPPVWQGAPKHHILSSSLEGKPGEHQLTVLGML